jgi:nicotinamidase-related amidase
MENKKALILVDIQNDYFPEGKMVLNGSEAAGINAGKILNHFRQKKLEIFHIRHMSIRPEATFFLPDTFGADIHECVKPMINENVIIKYYPNSFKDTHLLDKLMEKDIKELVICGMMTHMCIDATTRAAKDFGFNCTLIGDACATRDLEINGNIIKAEYVHNSFLAALNGFYSSVISTKEYLDGD